MAITYEPIQTQTLSSTATSITFSSIPSTYTDLIVIATLGFNGADTYFRVTPNGGIGDVVSRTTLSGNGSTVDTGTQQTLPALFAFNTGPVNTFSLYKYDFFSYSNTSTFKTVLVDENTAGTSGWIAKEVDLIRTTSAINSLAFSTHSGLSFIVGSTITLYGVKNA